MKTYMRKFLSMILVVALIATSSTAGLAEALNGAKSSAGDVFSLSEEVTWAQAGRQIAGMLGYIAQDVADIDLSAHSERIAGLSLEDDSLYLAILDEAGYLGEDIAQIDPNASITADEYIALMEAAFPSVVDSQEAADALRGETGNAAFMGDSISVTSVTAERLAVAAAQQLTLNAVKASALTLNAKSSVFLSESEIERVSIHDTAVKAEMQDGEEAEPDVIYLHMDSGTQLPEVVVKSADAVIIEGSGALGVVRVQETVGALTVRATGSVINETDETIAVTGPNGEAVELKSGEQTDFVLDSWLVSFVTEGTPVETQEIAPGGMIDFSEAETALEGRIFTAWYEDADYTKPVSRLSAVDRQMTLYARFIDESEAAVVTFETFGGRELESLVFAKGEYLLTKPIEQLYTSREGYSFGGWCADEDCTTAFGYTDPIEESMTLYAMYASYEQEVQEDLGTVAQIELSGSEDVISIVLPEGMTLEEAKNSFTVEAGSGAVLPEISVRETENGAELYCEAGFTPGTTFTLYALNGVRFAGQPEYIDTLAVSVFREEVEIVEFAEGLTYVLWDEVSEYIPVSETQIEYDIEYAQDGTEYNMLEEHDAEDDVIPGRLIMTGDADFQPEQIVVFYDGEINDDEATIDAWEGGDLAGYVLFAEIESVNALEDGTHEVIFRYADPEDYIAQLDVHTTKEVDIEELMDEEQIDQVEKAIASQLANNDELSAQMLVAVMTSEETQRRLDDKYGEGTYSLAAVKPKISNPKLSVNLSVNGSTATAGIGVGVTVSLYSEGEMLLEISPYLYFEEQLTLDINVDGGFLWVDMSVLFKTKSTVRLEIEATSGGETSVLSEAQSLLEEIVNADGTATEGYDYQDAANRLMNTMQELVDSELEYQELFSVPLLHLSYSYMGLITVGINVDLVGQAAIIASFGITVTAEYGQKIGFNYNFKKFKGGSYKEKLGSEVTTSVYLVGKIGARLGIAVTLYIKMCQMVTVSITGSVYAYVELAGMFMYTYALSAGGGNQFGALNLEVGIDLEIELDLAVKLIIKTVRKNWTLWSHRWKLYSMSRAMSMSIVQAEELEATWAAAIADANYKTSFAFDYLPMKTYSMLDGSCTDNQLLFESLQEGSVTARLSLENVRINGEAVAADDPRINVIVIGDGTNGVKAGTIYADEYAAAEYKVESIACDVVLTYENSNGSELIKHHQQRFAFEREFKMAVTVVNVKIALYDWCAHAWGIEAAEWDNATVYETSFENTHVLGCPVEPSATGEIDLDAVIAAVKARYPDIDGAAISWFNPTINNVSRVVQYSIPRISNLCYMTPESGTVRYDIFETTNEYSLTFNLFASRYEDYDTAMASEAENEQDEIDEREITYMIQAAGVPSDAVFTVSTDDTAAVKTFERVEGAEDLWTLTLKRAEFDGSVRKIRLSLNGQEAFDSGLTITGLETEDVVTLTLEKLFGALTIEGGEGIAAWQAETSDSSELSAVMSGAAVTLQVTLSEGYEGLNIACEPEGLEYSADGSTITFVMPAKDVRLTLQGVRGYQVNYLYNYGDLGVFSSARVLSGSSVKKPDAPSVAGLTFAGWYDNAACEGEAFDFSRPITADTTLYALWTVNVTVDFGGAKGQASYIADRRYEDFDGEEIEITTTKLIFPGDEKEYGKFTYSTCRLGERALDIVLPNYDGYDFVGWYTAADYSGEPVELDEYVLTGGVTFYARWQRVAMLTYELNNGEEEMTPYAMSLEHVGKPLSAVPEDPQRESYVFLGWFRTQNGGEVNRIDVESYIVEDSMTLYACWKPEEYTITYELGGGENNSANPLSYTVESDLITFAEPTRTGYEFIGWSISGMASAGDDGMACIPTGSSGNVVLTAKWEPIVYTISYDLIRGETANPVTYTIESADIVLTNPTADGYDFIGWSGTGLAEPTVTVTIPTGSVGNRSYKANWLTTDPIGRIVASALIAVPDEYTLNLEDFDSVQDILTSVTDAVAAAEACADYMDRIEVTVTQEGEADSDSEKYYYTVRVAVSYTDDEGNVTTDSKDIVLKVMKLAVTITAEVSYPEGSVYIPYGTALYDVELGSCTAISGTQEVAGIFEWAESSTVPRSANNGEAIYKVVFTPENSERYSTVETLVSVNTQIGVFVKLDVPDEVEYMGRNLEVRPGECDTYVVDADTGERLDDVRYSIKRLSIEQSQYTPGTATIMLTEVVDLTIYSNNEDGLYCVVDKTGPETSDTFTITRGQPKYAYGSQEYDDEYGDVLRDIAINMHVWTDYFYASDMHGTYEWVDANTQFNELGSYTCYVRFTPSDLELFAPATLEVQVNVGKKAIALPVIEPLTYDENYHVPTVPASEYYTVVSNEGGKDAGDYTITLKLNDTEHYVWANDAESETAQATFTIQPAALSVSGTASVMKLGFGQRIKPGKDGSGDQKSMTASEMISGLTVTGVNGEAVTGYWEWCGVRNTGWELPASAEDDDDDFGDGHSVEACFRVTSDEESNYSELRQTFTIEVARATPDVSLCYGRVQYEIYQPSTGSPVNKLGDFEISLANSPRNPTTQQAIKGTVEWEEPNIYPTESGTYNAVFTPASEYNGEKSWMNYRSVLVPIEVRIKNSLNYIITNDDQRLYQYNNPNNDNSKEVTLDRTAPTNCSDEVSFYVDLGGSSAQMCIRKITVKSRYGEVFFESTFTVSNSQTGECYSSNSALGLEVISYNSSGRSQYKLHIEEDADTLWARTDIVIELTIEELTSEERSNVRSYSLMQSMPAVDLAAAPTVEPTTEPTVEPTTEPTVEPTTEPTVEPTTEPTLEPTAEPTVEPTVEPTTEPTAEPTVEPTAEPTLEPTAEPTVEPTTEPTVEPTAEPTAELTVEPTTEPTAEPTAEPVGDEAA